MTNQDKPMSEALEAVRGMMEADRADPIEETPQDGLPADSTASGDTVDVPMSDAVADTAVSDDDPAVPPGRAEVLEEMVAEQITPIVRDWLEEHLPGIVARVVEREVRDLMGRRD